MHPRLFVVAPAKAKTQAPCLTLSLPKEGASTPSEKHEPSRPYAQQCLSPASPLSALADAVSYDSGFETDDTVQIADEREECTCTCCRCS